MGNEELNELEKNLKEAEEHFANSERSCIVSSLTRTDELLKAVYYQNKAIIEVLKDYNKKE